MSGRSPSNLEPCGTASARRRHVRRHEPVDAACRQAHADDERSRYVPVPTAVKAVRAAAANAARARSAALQAARRRLAEVRQGHATFTEFRRSGTPVGAIPQMVRLAERDYQCAAKQCQRLTARTEAA